MRIITSLVRGYQLIVSPWFAPTCRYYPSCSQYAIEAVGTLGPVRGVGAATWRLLRCNPWSRGGVDHVPDHWPVRGDARSSEFDALSNSRNNAAQRHRMSNQTVS